MFMNWIVTVFLWQYSINPRGPNRFDSGICSGYSLTLIPCAMRVIYIYSMKWTLKDLGRDNKENQQNE